MRKPHALVLVQLGAWALSLYLLVHVLAAPRMAMSDLMYLLVTLLVAITLTYSWHHSERFASQRRNHT